MFVIGEFHQSDLLKFRVDVPFSLSKDNDFSL